MNPACIFYSSVVGVDACTSMYLLTYICVDFSPEGNISIHVFWPIPDSFGGLGVSTIAVFAGLALHHANSAAGFKAQSPGGQTLL